MALERATALARTRSQACAECGRTFEPTRQWMRFCGDPCRSAHWRRTSIKSPPTAATEAVGDHDTGRHGPSLAPQVRSGTKLFNVLAELARGRSLNRFEAERDLHDHVLPSTIQKIERLGIVVFHQPETVPGFAGSRVQTVRYSLTPEEREKAAVLLGWKIWRAA